MNRLRAPWRRVRVVLHDRHALVYHLSPITFGADHNDRLGSAGVAQW